MKIFYTVQKGDTVNSLSKRWAIPPESLAAANSVSASDSLQQGQQLSVPPCASNVIVRQGDSVLSLSREYGIPAIEIIEANMLQPPYLLIPGQVVKIPSGVPYYIVGKGDTLSEIARKYNVLKDGQPCPEAIQYANNLPSKSISPGMRLIIPYTPSGGPGRIAFVSMHHSGFALWIYDPGSGYIQLVNLGLPQRSSVPYWSPGGKRIAFTGENDNLYIIHTASKEVQKVGQMETSGFMDWSPDGSMLAYSKKDEIVIYNTLTQRSMKLKEPGTAYVQWFPGGRWLLFEARDSAGISQLYCISAKGTGKRQLTRNKGSAFNDVRLSPNGLYILYTTPGASISIIYTVELSTGKTYEIPAGPLAKDYFPRWSPSSSALAYSSTAYEDRGYYSIIRITDRRGQNARTLALSDCYSTPVEWSPDGKKLTYLSSCGMDGLAGELWVVDKARLVPERALSSVKISSFAWSS